MARDWASFLHGNNSLIMAILNATPDSFFSQSRVFDPGIAADRARQLVAEGADIIDIGAESTRPGAEYVEESVERARLIPIVKAVRAAVEVPISIDTRKARVASAALGEGADIVNDISGLRDDPELLRVARKEGCPVVIMHMQGTPRTMQAAPQYGNVVEEILDFLLARARALEDSGIENLIIDPGIGFGKNFEHNMALISSIERFTSSAYPVLLGYSRKGFLGRLLGNVETPRPVDDRLYGGLGVLAWGLQRGVRIFRVHDVAASADLRRVWASLTETEAAHA